MKIFCVGKNYVEHAKEMNSAVPTTPVIFMKPETAYLQTGRPFYYPSFSDEVHYELELVLKVLKQGKNIAAEDVSDYIEEVTLGIDFTARDIQSRCKQKGHPWELAKSFDHSAVVGDFIKLPYSNLSSLDFHLLKNGNQVQRANTAEMVFNIEQIVTFVSERFTLQKGDLIYTGTPSGVGPVDVGDVLEGYLNEKKLLTTEIK